MTTRTAFISYSHADREFARRLDASLTLAGIATIRDERNAKVGDAIPDWIYSGISSSTDLIYVISEQSMESRWVAEEIRVAKRRQVEEGGSFRVLPVLLDEVEPPASVRHIKYADFTNWSNSEAFQSATRDLLRALGKEPATVDSAQARWWMTNIATLQVVKRELASAYGVLDAAIAQSQWFNTFRWVSKNLEDSGYESAIADLTSALRGGISAGRQIEKLTASVERVARIPRIHLSDDAPESLRDLHLGLGTLVGMLDDIESEVMVALSSAISFDTR